jgi:hypothetical protein
MKFQASAAILHGRLFFDSSFSPLAPEPGTTDHKPDAIFALNSQA